MECRQILFSYGCNIFRLDSVSTICSCCYGIIERNERLRAIVYFLSHERGKFRLKKGIQDTFWRIVVTPFEGSSLGRGYIDRSISPTPSSNLASIQPLQRSADRLWLLNVLNNARVTTFLAVFNSTEWQRTIKTRNYDF